LTSSKAFRAFFSSSFMVRRSRTRAYFRWSFRTRKMMSSTCTLPVLPISDALWVISVMNSMSWRKIDGIEFRLKVPTPFKANIRDPQANRRTPCRDFGRRRSQTSCSEVPSKTSVSCLALGLEHRGFDRRDLLHRTESEGIEIN
jgi:hypothetical protein